MITAHNLKQGCRSQMEMPENFLNIRLDKSIDLTVLSVLSFKLSPYLQYSRHSEPIQFVFVKCGYARELYFLFSISCHYIFMKGEFVIYSLFFSP